MYYGWWIVIACGTIFGASIGLSFFSIGTLFAPLEAEFGWTRGEISAAIATSFLAGGTVSILAGRLVDRFGPRVVIAAGGAILAIGTLLFSQLTAYWQLLPVLFVMSAGRVASTNPAINVTVANWFTSNRGLAFGFTRVGLSVGSLIAVPLTATLVTTLGWRQALQVIAVLIAVIVIPTALIVLRTRPPGAADATREPTAGVPMREVLRTRAFWAVGSAMACYFFAADALNLHMVSFLAERGMAYTVAATVAGVMPATLMIGSLALGAVADRFVPRVVLAIAFWVTAAAFALLWFVGGTPLVWVVVPIVGIASGGIFSVHATFLVDLFGLRAYGSILGGTLFVMTAGTILGPMTAGYLHDWTGSYAPAFVLFVIALILGGGIIMLARPPRSAVFSEPAAVLTRP